MWKVYIDGKIFSTSDSSEIAIGSPTLTYELNKSASFTFEVPATHPYKSSIEAKKSKVVVWNSQAYVGDKRIFRGFVRSIHETFYGSLQVACSDRMGYLEDSIQRPARYQDSTGAGFNQMLEDIISVHNSEVAGYGKRFTNLWPSTMTPPYDVKTNYETTMKVLTDVAKKYGGYCWYQSATDMLILCSELAPSQTPGQYDTPQVVLGANIIDLAIDTEAIDLCTRLIPLGAKTGTQTVAGIDDRLTVSSVNGGLDYIDSTFLTDYGPIVKTVVFDDISNATKLLAAGQNYLNSVQYENLTYDVKVADIYKSVYMFQQSSPFPQEFNIGTYYYVKSAPHGVNIKLLLTKKTESLDDPTKNTLTFGFNSILPISEQTAALNEDAAQAKIN